MANMAGRAPGVYVLEIPSADKPIAGVGTSTAGFIGVFADVAAQAVSAEKVGSGDGSLKAFDLKSYPVVVDSGSFTVHVAGAPVGGQLTNDTNLKRSRVTLDQVPVSGADITIDYKVSSLAEAGQVQLCTNFTEFTKSFGGFSSSKPQNILAHAVYGFFTNGGTRCYVVRDVSLNQMDGMLAKLAAVDEIAIVAAPGVTDAVARASITAHCEQATGDRFAILDTAEAEVQQSIALPASTTYAALYYPWLEVGDPVAGHTVYVPPSGHLAGIYSRVDTNRGVHKAPANEVVLGAVGLKDAVSKNDQGGLNDRGVNCIRSLNGNILVWGARTLHGPNETDLTYINVRRLLLFLRKSIEEGTQWIVFEPNSPALWQKIKRNITAFLTNVWRDGALFGDTADQAFYVRCDAETNPPELRDLGQVVTEIGVAIIRPAEFVVFRISQWGGPTQ